MNDKRPRTLVEKLWAEHLIHDDGEVSLLLIDRIMLHERTGGVALQSLANAGRKVANPSQVFVTMDHVVDTLPGRSDDTIMPTGRDFITTTRREAIAAGVTLFDLDDPRQGIVHVISPEQATVLPGLTLVCPDSHTCTQGALGALAWGIGSTEAEHALATGTLPVARPATMRVMVGGTLAHGVTAKDLALHIIACLGSAGTRGAVLEFSGSAIEALDVEARMTLCNMAAELGAFTAIIAPDQKTFDYLEGRPYAPRGGDWSAAVAHWSTLRSDPGAVYDAEAAFHASDVRPMVTWGTSPEQAVQLGSKVPFDAVRASRREGEQRALDYMAIDRGIALEELKITAAFIGSCTNSRLSDLRRAAEILKGRRVASHVRAICVPGSGGVKAAAEAEGISDIFRDAGFEWREPGCSMCFFAGGESFSADDRVVSSTNRNFERRQGPGTKTHLASPETVAASAILGRIASADELLPIAEEFRT